MKLNKVIVFFLTISMILSSICNVFAEDTDKQQESAFVDITTHWARDMISRMEDLGIVNDSLINSTNFIPEQKITRAEVIELVLKANLPQNLLQAELKEIRGSEEVSSFTDIDNHRLSEYIELSKKFEIVAGYEDNTFRPDGLITREEFVTVIVRSQDIITQLAGRTETDIYFSDINQGLWSYEFINTAAKVGIVAGYPNGTFAPKNNISKAEAYTMLNNYYNVCFDNYNGIVGFVSSGGKLLQNANAEAINLTDNKVSQSVTSNKYGQFRFDISDENEYKIEVSSEELLGILPKVATPLKPSLLEGIIVLEKTIQVSGTAYISSSSTLNSGTLVFECDGLEFKTNSDKSGKFDIKLLPERTYKVYRVNTNANTYINDLKVEDENISSVNIRPVATRTSSGGGGGGSSSSGNNSGNVTPSTEISLTVSTVFPNDTNESSIPVSYVATPSTANTIEEVSYSINGGTPQYLYLKGNATVTAKGTLGSGTVLLVPGENTIVFTAKESSNKTVSFTVANKPNYNFGTTPEYSSDSIVESSDGLGSYVNNRIIVMTKSNISQSSLNQAISSIGGNIVGQVNILDLYYVEVGVKTEEELNTIKNTLLTNYSSLFESVELDRIYPTDTQSTSTNDPWWHGSQWGLDAIRVTDAWQFNSHFREISIGVLDNGIINNHEDLGVPNSNVYNRNAADHDHGTHVMGTIGAIQNNNKGLAGIAPNKRLFGYDCFTFTGEDSTGASETSVATGLAWLVTNGSKLVNVSLGGDFRNDTRAINSMDVLFSSTIRKLVDRGYDFVITQAAGNGDENGNPVDAQFSGVFTSVGQSVEANQELHDRIIVVGATRANGKLAPFSNYGENIDVVAPGVDIYSTTANGSYGRKSGTSMAAPHVAGVAALVWSANPGLSGTQVKDIVVSTATEFGNEIYDDRTSGLFGWLTGYVAPPDSARRTYPLVDAYSAVLTAIRTTPEHVASGRIVGSVISAVDSSVFLNGASVALYSDRDYNLLARSTITAEEGSYLLDHITPGTYYLVISLDGYLSETIYVQVEDGVTSFVHQLSAVPETDETIGTVSGEIINAITGQTVTSTDVLLTFEKGFDMTAPEGERFTTTASSGNYSIQLPSGNYTVTAQAEGFIESKFYVVSVGGRVRDNQNGSISPILPEGQIRIVLTWGELPHDLDSHLVGPTPGDGRFHVYYGNKSYHYNNEIYIDLDVDDISSYGPETTTIHQILNGTYDFYVYDYTNGGSLTSMQLVNSQAVVRVYKGNSLSATYNVPTSGGVGTLWHVFSIVVSDDTVNIVPINTISTQYIPLNYNAQSLMRTFIDIDKDGSYIEYEAEESDDDLDLNMEFEDNERIEDAEDIKDVENIEDIKDIEDVENIEDIKDIEDFPLAS